MRILLCYCEQFFSLAITFVFTKLNIYLELFFPQIVMSLTLSIWCSIIQLFRCLFRCSLSKFVFVINNFHIYCLFHHMNCLLMAICFLLLYLYIIYLVWSALLNEHYVQYFKLCCWHITLLMLYVIAISSSRVLAEYSSTIMPFLLLCKSVTMCQNTSLDIFLKIKEWHLNY